MKKIKLHKQLAKRASKQVKHLHRSSKKVSRHLTKRKLWKVRTRRRFLRSFFVFTTSICAGSLALVITATKPTVEVAVHTNPRGQTLTAPATPKQPGAPDQVGKASWYALGLPAPDSLTCASTTFPRGTYLLVKNLRNGKEVTCLVNDYGPEAYTHRVIDLSRGSFSQIDSLGSGTTNVEIRVVSSPTSLNLPSPSVLGRIVGYQLCHTLHGGSFCEDHRQQPDAK